MKLFTLSLITLIISLNVNASEMFESEAFSLTHRSNIHSLVHDKTYSTSIAISPFNSIDKITGLSISGYIEKENADYLVRVIMKDTKGKEYLIMESYEELNSNTRFEFTNFCDETDILDCVKPDSIKVFLRHAKIHINNFLFSMSKNNMADEHIQRRIEQISFVIDKINSYNRGSKRLWVAGETELSKQEYAVRKMVLGVADDESTGGIEYYVGGIFQFGHHNNDVRARQSNYVDNFDWRNRHGKNWITSTKDQGWSNFCSVFAGVGCLEAMTNLYFNKTLNLDLSEQEIVDCSDTVPHYAWDGFTIGKVLNYLSGHGICLESDYPMNFCYDPNIALECLSNSIPTNELIRANGDFMIPNISERIKGALISNGPMYSGWSTSNGENGHAMVLVGYGTLHVGDSVYYYTGNNSKVFIDSISENDTALVGATYWIFKNSYINSPHSDNGCISIVFPERTFPSGNSYLTDFIPPLYLKIPISTMHWTDENIAIVDEDGDGYYNWGIGPKPASCPSWIPNDRDGDDSDPSVHYMDSFGKFPSVYTFPMGTDLLIGNRTISNTESLVNNIEINHGATLTITGAAYCLENVKIKNSGGSIIVDGGVIGNADIELIPPCSLTIRNGGSIYMKKDKDLVIPTGCAFNIEEGQVCKPYCRK